MSIAFERNNSGNDRRVEHPGFARHQMNFVSTTYNSQDCPAADRSLEEVEQLEDRADSVSSSSTASSIGKNSDDEATGGGDGDGEGEEVQSECKTGALESLDALAEVLPVKKSISKFYCGKSKSFTSLSDATSLSSAKDMVKPEDAYTRRRKNLLAHKYFLDKNFSNILRSNSGGISKRSANSRSTLHLAASMTNNSSTSSSYSSSPSRCLPPLPPHARRPTNCESLSSSPDEKFSPLRSFSLSDLQVADAVSPSITGLLVDNRDK
ncbi:unnamed protein product [Fraxinus pennsylvanica]|uniref:Uncharacterized protein n=1 Tax=Fraxinus pennsylvanica TaxID=56036 RepID=A0AAD2DUG9_9LAMI|nr:unnamed protein product [Fraxinus pennsylvanica]